MSPKSIIIILLAMSGSFATIIAVLGYALGPDAGAGSGNRRTRTANVVSVAPPSRVLLSHPQVAGFDIPDGPVPLSPTPALLPPIPEDAPDITLLARVTGRRFRGVEQALSRQVTALKNNRDLMLDDFAGQLAVMSVEEASATLAPLDDEVAALTLKRLGAARRKAILRTLESKRRSILEQLIKKLPSR